MRRPFRSKNSESRTLLVTLAVWPPCISTPWKAPQLALKASPATSARWNPGCLRRYSVASDFGALESGLLAEVLGDVAVRLDRVEPLHLVAIGAVGEVVLAGVAELQEEQEHQQDMRLRPGEGLMAPSGEECGGQQGDDRGQDDAVVGGEGQPVGEDLGFGEDERKCAESGEDPGAAGGPGGRELIDSEGGQRGGGELEEHHGGGRRARLVEVRDEAVARSLKDAVVAQGVEHHANSERGKQAPAGVAPQDGDGAQRQRESG